MLIVLAVHHGLRAQSPSSSAERVRVAENGDSAARAAFESSNITVYSPSTDAQWREVKVQHDAVVQPTSSGLKVDANGADPQLILPAFAAGKHVVVKVVLDTPAATPIQLFYLTQGQAAHSEDHMLSRMLSMGANTVYFDLSRLDVVDPLRLDPGAAVGDYLIRSITAKSVR